MLLPGSQYMGMMGGKSGGGVPFEDFYITAGASTGLPWQLYGYILPGGPSFDQRGQSFGTSWGRPAEGMALDSVYSLDSVYIFISIVGNVVSTLPSTVTINGMPHSTAAPAYSPEYDYTYVTIIPLPHVLQENSTYTLRFVQ